MRRRLSQILLLVLILLVGCKGEPPAARKMIEGGDSRDPRAVNISDDERPGRGAVATAEMPAGSSGDEVVAALPEPTKQQLYDQALLEAIDLLAERKYQETLAALEKAQKLNDTGAVQREIYKVQAMLDQQGAAEKAVQDVKTVLDGGKADEAARLAGAALGQYGGGDRAEDLAKLKQEADALVSAAANNTTSRKTALVAEAEASLAGKNLRAAAVSFEQALALGQDAALSKRLSSLQEQLATYDDCRSRAAQLRKEPTTVEEAITLLKKAQDAWPTLMVQQEIDECQLILERRRDRVSVADLEMLGDVGHDAGRIIAAELLPHFRPRFDIVERAQINRVLAELQLGAGDLADNAAGRQELGRAARLRYLVVGSLSPLGGVTLQARLVEVPTGLIVQTARVTAPTVEALVPKLKPVALMLQMTDEQKVAFEEALIQKVAVVKPIEAAPIVELPPPPPPPAPKAPPPPPIITYTPRPPALGGIVVEDFGRLPVAYVPPPPPPPLAMVLKAQDPRRHRLLRLSLELGDNCFRRGLFQDAQRHFQLAFTIGGPRRELSMRLDACRPFVAPPPPPPVVVVAPPVPPPLVVMPASPRPPVIVVPPPVVVVRPRVAVFGWVCSCRPGLVPPAASEVLADQFASYCRGSYEVIDRGEVCWYMGRLGLTMREVLTDEASRRCLAQALHARYFVFGSLRETASFDVETHLVDPETGTRNGTGKIHVKDHDELKLRLGELARQIGAKPDEQKALAARGAASEKALTEARGLLVKDPERAQLIARAALKDNPGSTALQALMVDAERRARLAKLEADRRAEAGRQAAALEQAKKRQADLAKQAAEAKAKAKAQADATARGEAARKAQQAQRERAAQSLRAQAKQAMTKGNYAQAVQQLQSAVNLQPGDAVYQELAAAKVAAAKAAADRALAEQKTRDDQAKAQREQAARLAQAEKEKRDKADVERRKADEARALTLHDGLLKQANAELAKKEYAKALASAESARRFKATPEAAKLAAEARQQLALTNAKDAAERKRLEDERKKREEADRKHAEDQKLYTSTMKKAQDALVAKKYAEAAAQYAAATKVFNTDAAKGGQKTANDLLAQEKKREADEKVAREAASRRAGLLKEKLAEGKRLRDTRQYAKAAEAYREAVKLAPASVEAVAGLSAAERERDAELAQLKQQAALSMDAHYKTAMQRGAQLMAAKQFAQAEKAYDDALKAKPGDAAAIQGKRSAIEAVRPTKPAGNPKMTPTETAYAAHMARGRQALAKKQFAEARQAFEQALKLKPNDPAAAKGVKDATPPAPPVKDAKGTAVRARQLKEDYDLAMSAGAAAMKKQNYKGAINAYHEALNKLPGDKAALAALTDARYSAVMARAAALAKEKKFADAVKAYDEALKLKPGDSAAIKGKKEATGKK